MKPRLDPAMGQIVICARVARWLTAAHYQSGYVTPAATTEAAYSASRSLPPEYPGMLPFALHSLAVYAGLGYSSSWWLAQVLEAAHFGHSFRRCFFFDYKANRGPYPRVTNRGVQSPPKRRHFLPTEGIADD